MKWLILYFYFTVYNSAGNLNKLLVICYTAALTFANSLCLMSQLLALSWRSDVDMLEEFACVWTQGVVLDLLPTSAKYVCSSPAYTCLTIAKKAVA